MDSDEITPTRAIRETWRWLPPVLIIGSIAVGVILILWLIFWQAGWWFYAKSVNRQASVIQHSLAYQTGQLTDLENSYTTVVSMAYQIQTAPKAGQQALIDQRLAIANEACAAASNITTVTIPAADKTWVAANCSGSSVSTGSSLRKGS
jgi:hypothetical protein